MSNFAKYLVAAALFAGANAQAAELLINGGFETGDYTGWTASVQSGSNGSLTVVANNGGTSPISGFAYQSNANGGRFFSITDQNGPGSYSLIQAFTLTAAGKVTISFDQFANNQSSAIFNNGRDYNTSPNQNAVVDLLIGSAGAFTDAAADIVSVLYGPGSDSLTGNPNPWTTYSSTLTLAAGTYQLRFAQTDNQGFFQQGVDNASVQSLVPEPATWALMLIGFGSAGAMVRRTRTRALA